MLIVVQNENNFSTLIENSNLVANGLKELSSQNGFRPTGSLVTEF